jgi:hypothetical protein
MTHSQLSDEIRLTAASLRLIRANLLRLLAEDMLPHWSIPPACTVDRWGLEVIAALEALADVPPPPKTPTHLDDKR